MKKAFFGLTALLIALLVSGCNQLTQYTISEQEVNQALQKHNNYEKDIGVSGWLMRTSSEQPDQSDWP